MYIIQYKQVLIKTSFMDIPKNSMKILQLELIQYLEENNRKEAKIEKVIFS